jgi:hypothetical protein
MNQYGALGGIGDAIRIGVILVVTNAAIPQVILSK